MERVLISPRVQLQTETVQLEVKPLLSPFQVLMEQVFYQSHSLCQQIRQMEKVDNPMALPVGTQIGEETLTDPKVTMAREGNSKAKKRKRVARNRRKKIPLKIPLKIHLKKLCLQNPHRFHLLLQPQSQYQQSQYQQLQQPQPLQQLQLRAQQWL